MRSIFTFVSLFAFAALNAQSPVPVSALPAADSVGKNDFFPIVQAGHYHKAYISQLPYTPATVPAGKTGYVQYNNAGAFGADSLFTRNPVTGLSSLSYYTAVHNKIGMQLKNIAGIFDGAAHQLYQPSTGIYYISGVVDASPMTGSQTTGVLGLVKLNGGMEHLFIADTGKVVMKYDTVKLRISRAGLTYDWNIHSYTFPQSLGTPGQVLTTDGGGMLSWQNATGGLQTVHVHLDTAAINHLYDFPLQLIPAPGPGKIIVFMNSNNKMNFNTAAYMINPVLQYYEADRSNPVMSEGTTLQATTSTILNISGGSGHAQENTPLTLSTYMGNPSGGDGTLDLYITYCIITE